MKSVKNKKDGKEDLVDSNQKKEQGWGGDGYQKDEMEAQLGKVGLHNCKQITL